MSPFRLFGSAAVALSALFLAVVIANWRAPARLHGGHDLTRMAVPCVMLMVVGVGTLLHQKWAAAMLCVACAVVGACVVLLSFAEAMPLWAHVVNIVLGASILAPGIVMGLCWPQRRSSGWRQ